MNKKFFSLPAEKQQRIINAAYKIFSQNDYKKAPMLEISNEGGISKALLFYYFENKKDLYLYLWRHASEITIEATRHFQVAETNDFFEMLERNLMAKCSLMQKYPYVCAFSIKAYYEQNVAVKDSIVAEVLKLEQMSGQKLAEMVDHTVFRQDIEFNMMYQEILWASDGYLNQKYRTGKIDAKKIEMDFLLLIEHWKKVYLRRDEYEIS